MAKQTISYVKSRFESGDIPTGADFVDLVDTLADEKVFVLDPITTGTGATITYDNVADLATLQTITGNPGEFAFVATDAIPGNNGSYQWSEYSNTSNGFYFLGAGSFSWQKRCNQKLSLPPYVAYTNGENFIKVDSHDINGGGYEFAFVHLPDNPDRLALNVPDRLEIVIAGDRANQAAFVVTGSFTNGYTHSFGTSAQFGGRDGYSFGYREKVGFQIAREEDIFSSWFTTSGAANIVARHDRDGWGNEPQVNRYGSLKRYSLSEDEYSKVALIIPPPPSDGVLRGVLNGAYYPIDTHNVSDDLTYFEGSLRPLPTSIVTPGVYVLEVAPGTSHYLTASRDTRNARFTIACNGDSTSVLDVITSMSNPIRYAGKAGPFGLLSNGIRLTGGTSITYIVQEITPGSPPVLWITDWSA